MLRERSVTFFDHVAEAFGCRNVSDDKDVALAAVGQNGDFAPDELKANREVSLAAVGEYGEALRCTSDGLRGGAWRLSSRSR